MEGIEWDAQTHGTVKTGRRAEETAIIGGEGEVGHCQGFQRLWAPPGDGDLLQIPAAGDLGGKQRMAGGGEEPVLLKAGLEEDVTHPQQGGGGAAGIRIIFQGCGTGGTDIWVGDLGGHLQHVQGPGGVSEPGVKTTDGTDPV